MTWNLRSAILSALPWAVGGRLAGRLLAWGGGLIVLRHVTPADLGIFAMAALVLELAAILRDFGLSAVLVQRADLGDRLPGQVAGISLVSVMALATVLFAAAPLVADWFGADVLQPVLWLVCLPVLLECVGVVPEALLRRAMKFKALAMVEISAIAFGGAVAVLMALSNWGVWALAWGLVARIAVRSVLLPLVARRLPRPDFDLRGIRADLEFGGHVTARKLLALANRQVDVLIVGRMLGATSLGSYRLGVGLSKMVLRLAAQDLNAVAFPALSRVQTDLSLIGRYYRRAAETLSLLVVPLAVGLFLLARDLVPVVFGAQWEAAIAVIEVTSLLLPIHLLGRLLPAVVNAIGRPGLATRNSIVSLSLFVPALLLGAPFGLPGVAAGYALSQAAAAILALILSVRAWDGRLREALTAGLPAFACGAAMLFVGLAARELYDTTPPSPERAVITGLVSTAAYIAATLLINRNCLARTVALVRR